MFPKTAERSKPASKLQSRPESSAIPSSKNDEGSEGEAILDAASNAESEEVFFYSSMIHQVTQGQVCSTSEVNLIQKEKPS